MKLAADNDLAGISIEPSNTSLQYATNASATLNFQIVIENKVSQAHEYGIYEVFLTDTAKQHVQPLIAKEASLNSLETKTLPESFEFKLPPANQLSPGNQDYLLELVYSGRTGSRNFVLTTYSTNKINISVML
jgi:hypothetical protein